MRYLSMTQQGIEGRPPGVARRVVSARFIINIFQPVTEPQTLIYHRTT